MTAETGQRAGWATRVSPLRPADVRPPLVGVPEVNPYRGLREHERAGVQHLGQGARIVCRVRLELGEGDVPRRVHEPAKLVVRDREPVDPESTHRHAMRGRFLHVLSLIHISEPTRLLSISYA